MANRLQQVVVQFIPIWRGEEEWREGRGEEWGTHLGLCCGSVVEAVMSQARLEGSSSNTSLDYSRPPRPTCSPWAGGLSTPAQPPLQSPTWQLQESVGGRWTWWTARRSLPCPPPGSCSDAGTLANWVARDRMDDTGLTRMWSVSGYEGKDSKDDGTGRLWQCIDIMGENTGKETSVDMASTSS